jgi:hypothetical protein
MQQSPIIFKRGASLLSSDHVLLWVRECSQGLFVSLVLAAGEQEVLYLRTRWWLGEAQGVWNTAALISCFIQFIRTEVDVYILADWEFWPKWRFTVPQTVRAFLTLTFLNYALLGDVPRFAGTPSKILRKEVALPKKQLLLAEPRPPSF